MMVAAPEAARVVAKSVVPLAPAAREITQLVAARRDVPWLGDELQLAELRVLVDSGDQRSLGVEAVCSTPQAGRKIEAEAVHSRLADPGAERVGGQAHHGEPVQRQRVPAAAVV